MAKENYEPTQEEVDQVCGDIEDQMEGEPVATGQNLYKVLGQVTAQLRKETEVESPTEPEEDIIEKYREGGWNFVDVITNAASVRVHEKKGKVIKIVGLGNDKFLIFEKDEGEK
jgi:hypothetical protein